MFGVLKVQIARIYTSMSTTVIQIKVLEWTTTLREINTLNWIITKQVLQISTVLLAGVRLSTSYSGRMWDVLVLGTTLNQWVQLVKVSTKLHF